MGPLIAPGSRVRLRSRAEATGRVIQSRPYPGGYQYLALISGEENWYAGADLEAMPEREYRWETSDAFLRDLLIAKLKYPVADSLYAYRASRTVFEAYQFRPALKFLRNPEQRLLIADEVGLGKTIEAAIIYLELKARMDIARVLVLCPARLKAKWISELRNRFDEKFEDLDVGSMRRLFEDYDRFGQITFRGVASYETLRRDEIIQGLSERQFPLDLLIADEAHHMRNAETATYRLGTALADQADAVVFLTATPLHLGNQDLFHLLQLLLPAEYENLRWFEEQIRPNTYINQAVRALSGGNRQAALEALRRVESTLLSDRFVRNPYYTEIVDTLSRPIVERSTRVYLQRDLLELNTLANVFTRTRKREVANAAVRAAYSVDVQFTPSEMAFYQGILRHVRLQLRSSGSAVHSFAIISRERMAASCLAAMREMFEESTRLGSRTEAQLETPLFDSDDNLDEMLTVSTAELRTLSRSIGAYDSKFELFKQTIEKALAEGEDSKALVFSFYRRTLAYLHRRLQDAGFTVDVIHGGVPISDRQAIIEQFRLDPKLRILLSSEVGAEGLDFQFCDVLVNYDLPWNPMQVEQRIGRLDRFGQKHKRIRIFNFFIADTVESRIFQRLYDRIEIFRSSIGDLEDILGAQIRDLSKRVMQTELTPEEETRLAEEAADRIIQRKRADEELEAVKDELMGQDAIFSQQVTDTIQSGRVVHSDEVRALVETFLKDCFDNIEFTRDADEPTYTLTVTPQMSAYLVDFMRRTPTRFYTSGYRFDEAMGRNKHVALTFDADFARERNLLEFVTHQHLLVVAALEYWSNKLADGSVPSTRLEIDGQHGEHGEGHFFVYALDERGLTNRRTLYPIIVLDNGRFATETAKTLLHQLPEASRLKGDEEDLGTSLQVSESDANTWMAEQRDQVSLQAHKRHQALLNIRETSITESYNAKIRRAEQMLMSVRDSRIQRLYEGQIRNLSAQREIKLAALREKDGVTVSHTLIAAGRIRLLETVHKPQKGDTVLSELSVGEKHLQQPVVDNAQDSRTLVTSSSTEPSVSEHSMSEGANETMTYDVGKFLQRLFRGRE